MVRIFLLLSYGAILVLLTGGMLLPSGCARPGEELVAETDERSFQRGRQFLREGRNEEALVAFLRLIDERSDAAESHLEAGTIYLQHLEDPILAIYHFSRFLERRPNSQQAPLVRGLIEQSRRLFARQLPGQPFADDFDRLDLLEMLEDTRRDNTRLRQELVEAQNRIARLEERLSATVRQPAPPRTEVNRATSEQIGNGRNQTREAPRSPGSASPSETYTVVPGDTLSRISQRIYGTPARWRDIFEANRHILNSPDDLRVGQILNLPSGN